MVGGGRQKTMQFLAGDDVMSTGFNEAIFALRRVTNIGTVWNGGLYNNC